MKVGFIGSKLNLWSGSAKPIFQIMKTLEDKGITTNMLSDSLSNPSTVFYSKPIYDVQDKLEKKLDLKGLNQIRIKKNLISSLISNDSDSNLIVKQFIESCDLIIATDFMLAWLIERNKIPVNTPIYYLASNNLDLNLKLLIDAGLLTISNLMIPDYLFRLSMPKFGNKFFLKKFNGIIATSKYVQKIFLNYSMTLPIYYVPIGVDIPKEYTPINPENLDTFMHFGWGSNIRGLPDVVTAFQIFNKKNQKGKLNLFLTNLHGFEENYLIRKIKRYNNPKISINYFSNNIEEEIKKSSVVILPFRIPFGYSQPPLVVLESMALGRCVLSTNVGSISEYIISGKTGYLVNKKAPLEISNLLEQIKEIDLNKVGKDSYNYMKEKYDWKIVINDYIALFNKIK